MCGETKPVSAFGKNSGARDGLFAYCRPCSVASALSWREKNREHYLRYMADYYEANAERLRQSTADWRKADPERARQVQAKHRAAYPEKHRQHEAARRARMAGSTVRKVDYLAILERDQYICHICGGDVDPGDVHFDHVIPLARGGAHSVDNIAVAHSLCNMRKGDSLIPPHADIDRSDGL